MMTILERIARIFLGGQPKSCPLITLFQEEENAEKAIVLEETGFPYGGVTTLMWWKTNSGEFFRKVHESYGASQSASESAIPIEGGRACVEKMVVQLSEFNQLKNYSGHVRDGVVYRVAWGTRERQHTLTISNPPADSRHYQLVKQVKEHALN